MRSIMFILLCLLNAAHAETSQKVTTSLGLGYQACLAEGGAICSDSESGGAMALSTDIHLDWFSVGLESGYGQFPGTDGIQNITVLAVLGAQYEWQKLAIVGDFGFGLVHTWQTRAERSVGDVTYSYTNFSALRFGGGLTYDLDETYTVGVLSHLLLSGKGELCVDVPNHSNRCVDDQDMVDLFATVLELTYHF